jgi:hypothetical protein
LILSGLLRLRLIVLNGIICNWVGLRGIGWISIRRRGRVWCSRRNAAKRHSKEKGVAAEEER